MSDTEKTINVEQDIRELLAIILENDEPNEIDPNAHFVKDLGMDSMMALELLASIEKKYRLIIPEDYLKKFTNITVTVNLVTDLLKNRK